MMPSIHITFLLAVVTYTAHAVHAPNTAPVEQSTVMLQQGPGVKAALRPRNHKQREAADSGFLTNPTMASKTDKHDEHSEGEGAMSFGNTLYQTFNVATAMSRSTSTAIQDDIGGLVHSWVRGMVSWPPATLAKWQAGGDMQEMSEVPPLPRHNESIGQLTDQLLKHLLTTKGAFRPFRSS